MAMSQREDKRLRRRSPCGTGRRCSVGRRSLRCRPPVGVEGGGAGSSGGGRLVWFVAQSAQRARRVAGAHAAVVGVGYHVLDPRGARVLARLANAAGGGTSSFAGSKQAGREREKICQAT